VPDAPNFKDNELDKPIQEMEKLIARTLAERNFEIEQIHNKINPEEAEKWLQPKETSLKSEKDLKKPSSPSIIKSNASIENKQVTWNDNINFEIKEKNIISSNIFSKLKMKPISEPQQQQQQQEQQQEQQEQEQIELTPYVNSESDKLLETNKSIINVLQDEIKDINNKLDKMIEMNAILIKFLKIKKN
jgi:hypothetical protein